MKQQRSTFNQIIYTTFVVAAIVIALFFALITLEKRTQLAILKAVGASSRYLATGIVVQSLLISVIGGGHRHRACRGVAATRCRRRSRSRSEPPRRITVAVGTVVTGALGAAFSFRRVTRIDPASALGGA